MTVKPVQLGKRAVGPGHPVYLVVEVGTTCLGDLDKALRLVAAGAAAGVDAMKFQLIDPEQLSDKSVTYPIRTAAGTENVSMYDMMKRLRFEEHEWRAIAEACAAAGMDFFATVDFVDGVDLLERVGVPAHKMGAWDVTFRPLVERIGRTGKPLFVDLGPATPAEVDQLIDWYRAAGGQTVLFMHDFHTELDSQMNLRTIPYVAERYGWPSGFSSPALDHDLDFAALALGANYLEKRLILSRSEKAFHAHESCEPDELADWVRRIRHVERALGRPGIIPTDRDREMSQLYYRSVATLVPVAEGEAFAAANLGGKRPGTGLPTAQLPDLWGRRARRALPANHLLTAEDVE
jgi:sialic acid synthase SpsE